MFGHSYFSSLFLARSFIGKEPAPEIVAHSNHIILPSEIKKLAPLGTEKIFPYSAHFVNSGAPISVELMKLLIATRNKNKFEEIQAIFTVPVLELMNISDYPELPEVVENGATFEANAIKKAVTFAIATKLWTMADDSGLEVDALDGAPGIYSARYAGEDVSYEANNKKLLKELENVTNRQACFRCVIALSNPSGQSQIVEGECKGRIVDSPRGNNGFGYDPLFMPDGQNHTFAEMESELKNRISHRAIALNLARKAWGNMLARYASKWNV